MSHDALFQLGMGSVGLDATQTEEPFGARAMRVHATALCATDRGICPDAALWAAMSRAARTADRKTRERGNSAKALFPATGLAACRA